jgi:hypothetical protein
LTVLSDFLTRFAALLTAAVAIVVALTGAAAVRYTADTNERIARLSYPPD